MPTNDTPESLVKRLVHEGLSHANGNLKELARLTKIPYSTLSGWKNGTSRKSDPVEKLYDFVNQRSVSGVAEQAASYGVGLARSVIRSGNLIDSKLVPTDTESGDVLQFPEVWRRSPWWVYTDFASPVMLADVRDDSMDPDYPKHTYLALRKLAEGTRDSIPGGAPCVFKGGHLRVLMRLEDGGVIGVPLNAKFPVVLDQDIEYLVLGCIQPKMPVTMKFDPPRHRPKE